ncbi:response regulator transcription factor [Chromobacterium haemolyticum]|uniref:Response regulator transcription factor n=1 Tax=Chromobacterium fluminis TaxID=3044269 RepID=A0ABX0L508_9NEIS|nr:LytTR family DNA-binding domain-containing protein [Chromobacterium haemolyticum]NHR04574.1 response regulator transcription factor [Chromobacterium haemolyticum]
MGAVNPWQDWRALVVDDEPLACERLRQLLREQGLQHVYCLTDSRQAMAWLTQNLADIVLADISMPGVSGLELAQQLRRQPLAPQLIFTTAHEQYAVNAFELEAIDYLLKPVRRERLRQALERACRQRGDAPQPEASFTVRQRDRLLPIPFSQARYLKAELKYVTLVTPDAEYLLDETLIALEQRLGNAAVRIHRNCLVMRHALRELFRANIDGEEQWQVRLADIGQPLPVSRRQLAGIKQCLHQQD